LLTTVTICFLGACEKRLDFDGDVTKSKLVVNEDFSPSSNMVIHVSNSLSVIDPADLVAIENAEVKLYHDEVLLETLSHTTDGFYQGPEFTIPEVDVEYRLEVSAPGFDPVSSRSIAPSSQLEILNIDTTYLDSEFGGGKSLRLNISLRDNDPGENYYGIGAEALFTDSANGETYVNEMYLNSTDVLFGADNGDSKYGSELYFDDALLNQNTYVLSLNIENIEGYSSGYFDNEGNFIITTDTAEILYLRIFSYSKDLFLYNRSIERYYETEGNPFAQPTQVYSNIDGGFGVFGGFNQTLFEFDL